MKKKIIVFMMTLLFTTIPISAKSEMPILIGDADVNVKELNDSTKQKQITNYSDPELVEVNIDANTKVYYKLVLHDDNEVTRYGEWFKKVNGKYLNYKETYEEGLKTKYEEYYQINIAREYYIDNTKINNTTDIINNNGQGNLKSVIGSNKAGEKTIETVSLTYSNKANIKYDMYDSISLKVVFNGKLHDYRKIVGTRDQYNRVTSVASYEYDEKGKVETKVQSLKIDYTQNRYDLQRVESFGTLTTSYDRGFVVQQIATRSYDDEDEEEYIDVDVQVISYVRYKNGKVRLKEVIKNNSSDKTYYQRQYKYATNGKRQGAIIYNFKNGKTVLRKEYVYNKAGQLKSNKKGKAYRYTTTYNKYQKRVKTQRQKYNAKGKFEKKKYKVKHRKDFM